MQQIVDAGVSADVFRDIVENAKDAIIAINDRQIIVYCNEEACKLFHYNRHVLIGKSLSLLIPDRQRAAHAMHFDNLLGQDIGYRAMGRGGDICGKRSDGSIFPAEVSVSTTRNIAFAIIRDQTLKKELHDSFHQLAYVDQLTKADNVFSLRQKFERRAVFDFAFLCFDIHRLKSINEIHGYATGDLVLQKFSSALRNTAKFLLGEVYRIGADDFIVVLSIDAAAEFSRIFAGLFGEVCLLYTCMKELLYTEVLVLPEALDGLSGVLAKLDETLRYAKKSGAEGCVSFDETIRQNLVVKSALLNGLEEAVQNGEIFFHYQPIYCADRGAVIGYEALARWCMNGDMIPPPVFVELAEDLDVMEVLQAALFDSLKKDIQHIPDNCFVAINATAKQILSDYFYQALSDIVASNQLAPGRIEVELTENSLLGVDKKAIAGISRLRNMGIRISLDDFGTGYSCLSYISTLHPDKIKIDRSFVSRMGDGGVDHAIVKIIIELANSLGAEVLAEGVETGEQVAMLAALGCTTYQGYYYGKPGRLA